MEQQNTQSSDPKHVHIVENKELSIGESLIPVIALVLMLFYNVFFVFGDDALSGSNQFILLQMNCYFLDKFILFFHFVNRLNYLMAKLYRHLALIKNSID